MAEKYLFPRLNNQNYSVWKTRMEMLLKREELWYVISDARANPVTAAWSKSDQKCHATIVLYVEDSQLNMVKSANSAKDVWELLKKYHEKTSLTSRVSLLKRLCSLNMAEGADVEKHLFDLEELYDRLACAGQALEDPMKIAMLLRSLPESYGGLVTALESRPEADLTMALVKQKLLDEYQRRSDRSADFGESAMKLQWKRQQKQKVCYHCKKPGHFRRDCQDLRQKKTGEHSRSGKADKVNVKKDGANVKQAAEKENPICFTVGSGRRKDCWYIDSGCSCHMTNDRAFFTVLDDSKCVEVVLADGSMSKSHGMGEGLVKCVDQEGNVLEVKLTEVLYIPNLDSGLISVRKLTQKGFAVNFLGSTCSIVSEAGKTVALGEIYGSLFILKTVEFARLSNEAHHGKNCQHVWHRRFGHRDPAVLDRLKHGGIVEGFQVQDCGLRQVCETCLEGKLPRCPFPNVSNSRASRILDLIHTDVCGPMSNVTPGGNRYLMTLIDDFSRYTVVCLLARKSDVANCIKRYVAHVKTRFGRAPCVIRSDGGGEYVNKELQAFYAVEGIQAQYTTAYSPQQNGVAERKNRTLQEMASCMLLDAKLPKRYWGEAIMTAAYVQNRLPSRVIDKTPYEKWFGVAPVLSHFRIFGSPAYVHIPAVKRSKFDSKAKKLLFVGYCEDRKAYRFLDPETDRITVSRDAQFIEHRNGSHELEPEECENVGDDGWTQAASNSEQEESSGHEELPEKNPSDSESPQKPIVEEQSDESEDEFYDWEERVEEEIPTLRREKRSTRGIPPRRYGDFVVDVAMVVEGDPSSYEEAIRGSESDLWKAAMQEEYDSLMKNKTWNLVELPAGRKAIGSKWVYKKKEDSVGNVSKFKARLVAQGFSQQFGVDYDAVFAPVATQTTLRTLLAVAGKKKMKVRHLDVKSAYLHGQLKEELYMQQPKGFVRRGEEKLVCRLQRSLYGLKQGAKVWNDTIRAILEEIGFQQSRADPCLFNKSVSGRLVYLLIYVDDIIVASEVEEEIDQIECQLKKKVELSSLGEVSCFLGMRVSRDENGFYALDQQSYISKIASKFGLDRAKGSKVPLDVGYYRSREGSKVMPDNKQYHCLVGALLYVAVNTRPDISASVSILSRRTSEPTEVDWLELKRVVRYLVKTMDYKLKLSCNVDDPFKLVGYSDADWSGDTVDRKSNTGYLFQIGGATICWASRKQTSVALSSMEAEYVALSEACRELLWLRKLLEDFGFKQQGPTTVFEDNISCIDFTSVDRTSRRSKHIDTRKFFAKDLSDKGLVSISYCPSESMVADILTKPLGSVKQQQFATMMGLIGSSGR